MRTRAPHNTLRPQRVFTLAQQASLNRQVVTFCVFIITILSSALSSANGAISVSLLSPTNGQAYASPATVSISANADPGGDGSLIGLGFYATEAGLLGSALTPPYTISVSLTSGTYRVFAVATNDFNTVTFSETNRIFITNVPLSIRLTAPTNGEYSGETVVYYCYASVAPGSNGNPTAVNFYDVTNGFLRTAARWIDGGWTYYRGMPFNRGVYDLYATVSNSLGEVAYSATNRFTVTNIPPTVFLDAPTNGSFLGAPARVFLKARAFGGGTGALLVNAIAFYTVERGFLTNGVYPYFTNGVTLNAGTYKLYAVVTNSRNDTAYSATNTITVADIPLSVTLSTPTSGTFCSPVLLGVNAFAGTGATLTGVAFYDEINGLLTNATVPPFTNSIRLRRGSYSIYCLATNSLGAIAFSITNQVTVSNIPPSVTLNDPDDGTSYGPPANIYLSATANAGSGARLSSVAFYVASTDSSSFLFSCGTAPYAYQVSGLPAGTYRFYAVATNELNEIGFSSTNVVIVSDCVQRGPYLCNRSSTGIVVRWRTSGASVGRVYYGVAMSDLSSYADDTAVGTNHSVTLSDLNPQTTYYYAIGTSNGVTQAGSSYYFSTAPAAGVSRPTRTWFISDYGMSGTVQANVRDSYLDYIATDGHETDVWITGGDNEQTSLDGYDWLYQRNIFDTYSNLFVNSPIFPTCGNHDGGSNSAYWDIFNMPTNGECGGYFSGTQHYYSFDYANIHFISLDANNILEANTYRNQLAWLTNDLSSTTQRWIIAYWHQPPYSKNYYDSDRDLSCMATRACYNPTLESFGVDLVLSGHCHCYQRTYLINGHYGFSSTFRRTNMVDAGDGRVEGTGAYLKHGTRGTVYVTAPSGCGSGRAGSGTMPAFAVTLPWTIHGSITFDVSSNHLSFKCLDSASNIVDSFSIIKGDSQSIAPNPPANLTASALGTSISLAWSDNAINEMSYLLECSTNGGDFHELATVAANLTNWTGSGLNLSGAYYYRLRSWNNAGYSDYSSIAAITPYGPLTIDAQPRSVRKPAGTTAQFCVLARGSAPITYQWYFENTLLSGETNNTITISPVGTNDVGAYTVVVSDGKNQVASNPAILAIGAEAIAPLLIGAPQVVNGILTANFQATPLTAYTIQSTDSLGGTWNTRTNVTVPPSGILMIQDDTSSSAQRFYRILLP